MRQERKREPKIGDSLLKACGFNPNEWTIGDRVLASLTIVTGFAIVAIAVCAYVWGWGEWTGITKSNQKTFWDWLGLLIVPVVLALGGHLFSRSQDRRAAQQRKRDRDRANGHRQDQALQAYLDKISQLLTDKDSPLEKAQQGDPLSTVARAWTLTVLDTLDSSRLKGPEALDSGRRKRRVLKFLFEANLICADRAIVRLSNADL